MQRTVLLKIGALLKWEEENSCVLAVVIIQADFHFLQVKVVFFREVSGQNSNN